MLSDQRFAASRPDVLVYTTSTLTEDMTLAGPIEMDLWVSTSGNDADWFVKVIDVYSENEADYPAIPSMTHMGEYQSLVRLGVLRGRFRKGFENPIPFTPGAISRVRISLDDVSHTFKKGHRFMIQIQSSCFPLFDINPQQFVNLATTDPKAFIKATHRVHRSSDHSSHLTFRVINHQNQTKRKHP